MKPIVKNGITEGVIWSQLLIFFFPLLFGAFIQQLYITIDAIVVGRYIGKEALSAVGGTTGALINIPVCFFMGAVSGAAVAVSQYYGKKSEEDVSKAVHTAVALSIVGGVVIMVIGLIAAPTALRWMGTPDDIMPDSLLFIRIYFSGMIANLFYCMGTGILRAVGDSRRPLYFMIAACLMNILLDLLFVIVFQWGVMGVGIATVISQTFGACMVGIVLMRTNHCYKLHIRKIHFHSKMLKKIIRIGGPTGLQSLMYCVPNLMVQSSINSFGTDTIAAWSVFGKIDGLFWIIMGSFGISITTFVGQNFGAEKIDRVRQGVKACYRIALTVAVCMSIVLYFGGESIYHWFTQDPVVIAKGMEILHFLVPTYITYVSIEILSGSLRGMSNTLIPMMLTIFGVCMLRIAWIIIAVPIWPNIKTIIFSYPLAWAVTSLFFIFYYRYFTKREFAEKGW